MIPRLETLEREREEVCESSPNCVYLSDQCLLKTQRHFEKYYNLHQQMEELHSSADIYFRVVNNP